MTLRILIILGLSVFTACSSNRDQVAPTPTPTPESQSQHVAAEEDLFQRMAVLAVIRAEARQAAADYLRTRLPNWTVKGIATAEYQSGVFWIDVDLEKQQRSVVVSLAVRKFFPESGEPYWKAVSLNKTLKAQLHDLNDTDLFNRLADALEENREMERQIPDEPEPEEPPDRR